MQIIGRYRELTGEVPLFGRWAYGFWQCKNKYESQQELETVAAQLSRRAHSRGQHCAGLVLVGHHGRNEVELRTTLTRRA